MQQMEKVAEEMRRACEFCYLDTGAMSLMPECVRQEIEKFHIRRQQKGPDFGAYWRRTSELRNLVANKIHADSQEIMFLQNTSMVMNLAANALPLESGDNIVITDMEFPSNAYPWMNLKSRGVEVKIVKNRDGEFLLSDFEQLCDDHTKAISVSWVIAGNGAVLDLKKLSDFCRVRNYFFVVDAIQGLGVLPLDLTQISVDILGCGFFKWLLGPDGLAFAYINKDIMSKLNIPFIGWAGMEKPFDYSGYHFCPANEARRYETGNMNFSAIYGAAVALELTRDMEMDIYEKTKELTAYLRENLRKIPGIQILSPVQHLTAGITLFTCGKAEELYQLLRKNGVIVNFRNGIRVSVHFYNSREQIDRFLNLCREFQKRQEVDM